jgi:hypothetical protein
VVLIEYPDRLVRFGFGYLEEVFGWKQVRIEVVEPPKAQSPTAELVQDLLTIVTVFSGRLHGRFFRKYWPQCVCYSLRSLWSPGISFCYLPCYKSLASASIRNSAMI